MAYTDVFGGQLIFPSQLSYLAITTAVDVELQWPTEQQITSGLVVADFLDISTTAIALSVDLPDARNTSTGNKTTINNIGGNAFTVRDATGGVVQFISPGQQWVVVLTDNSTEAGVWSSFQLGAATTLASASALAGAGLQADGFGMLEQIIDSDVKAATPFNIVDGDRAKCLIYTAGAGTANLPAPGTVGNNWFCMLRNSGSGTLNIVPGAGLIDGSASENLDPNGSTFIFTDGANFFTVGLTVASTIAFDFVSLPVPGSGDFVLSGANLNRIAYRFTGALTGNRNIVVPNTTQQYWVDNQTTGAFTLSIKTAAQVTPPTLGQGDTAIFYCDATNVVNAVSTVAVVFPITISQGGTAATTAAGARTNLQAAFDGRLISSGAGLSGGGDLTADRTLLLDINSANTTPTAAVGDFFAFEDIDDNLTYKTTIQDIIDLVPPSGITIEDEGTPLATLADTLDFTGGIVTASGAGTTKTIDIPIAASTSASRTLRGDGFGGWVEEDNVRIEVNGLINVAGVGSGIRLLTVLDVFTDSYSITLNNISGNLLLRVSEVGTPSTTYHFSIEPPTDFDFPIRLEEQAAAPAVFNPPGANYGQIWVKDEAPNILAFTDDDGDSYIVSNQIKFKNVSTTRGATGVSDDPQLSGWTLSPGYWRFYGSIAFTVNPSNGGIDLNWSTAGTFGSNFGQIITRDDDLGVTVGNAIEASFIPTVTGDTTLVYATRNDQTRAYLHGVIEVTATATVGFQWAPRLAANQTMVEGSWILFQKMDV